MVELWAKNKVFETLDHLRNHCQRTKFEELARKLQSKEKKSMVIESRMAFFQAKHGSKLDILERVLFKKFAQSSKEALAVIKEHTEVGLEGDASSFALKISDIMKLKLLKLGFLAVKAHSEVKFKKSQPSYKQLNALQKLRKHKQFLKALKSMFFSPILRRAFKKIKEKSHLSRNIEGVLLLSDLFRVSQRRTVINYLKNNKISLHKPQRTPEIQVSTLKGVSMRTASTHVSERFV